MQPDSLIKFVARISKPNLQYKLQSCSKSLFKSKATTYDKLSIFTTYSGSNLLLASELPISQKLLKSALISANDLPYFNSMLKAVPSTFTFDSVSDHCSLQEKFYNSNVKPLLKELYMGKSVTMICLGLGGSGKAYT